MKKTTILLFGLIVAFASAAQAPEMMSYQSVIRDAENKLVSEENVSIRISILQGSAEGTVVYEENHAATSNSNGLVSLMIGAGTTTDNFSDIDWSDGPFFIKTETDPSGVGTDYSITGTSQILSVPYALHANIADSLTGGIEESDPIFNSHPASLVTLSLTNMWSEAHDWGNHADSGYLTAYVESSTLEDILSRGNEANTQIKSLEDPQDPQDAATKAYIDALITDAMNTLSATHESFTSPTTGTIKDIDGNVYGTVKIGDQWWMTENLRVTRYNDEAEIPKLTTSAMWDGHNDAGYRWRNNDSATYANPVGAYYKMETLDTNKNICPTGWHVPAVEEWNVLFEFLGGDSIAGGKMKSTDPDYWDAPNTGATNESGFNAIGSGYCDDVAYDDDYQRRASYLSYPDETTAIIAVISLRHNNEKVFIYEEADERDYGGGWSIRCVRD